LISELVTNAIRHAPTAADQPLRLIASFHAAALYIEIHDAGTDGTVARRTPQLHDDAGGFGLDLVQQLASCWGVDRDEHGTTVWLELTSASAAST
jgi:anti-sigma regulatory factor (Ser/Thr protein kinase)